MIRRRLYNPAQLTPDELKASFVGRGEDLAEMLRLLQEQAPGRPCQHLMLIGPRGMGKTTLGLRFLHALGENPALASDWQPVAFYEENYRIVGLADFWLAALFHLTRATGDPRWADRAEALAEDEGDPDRLAAYALAALTDFCHTSGKRLLLFVENLDAIFDQFQNEREVHQLRAILIERPEFLLLGSANAVFEAIRGHGQPFYEFFRLIMLEGLGQADSRRILEALAEGEERPDVPKALDRDRGRLEAIRRLTGGNPRLLVLACRMLIESPLGSAFEDLERLIDEQTPYFKARIEELPVQARKVFDCLAEGWRPMLAKEMAGTAKLTSSHVSAQLKQLVEKGYAREVRLPGAKRIRYEVGDRFYNIYYLLRFSRAGRERLERLVFFLHDLFGSAGMRTMYPKILVTLRGDGVGAGELSGWLGAFTPHVARDPEFGEREAWLRDALDLVVDRIGPDAPVVEEIQEASSSLDREDRDRFAEWMQRASKLKAADRFHDAEAAFRRALEIRENSHAWVMLGIVLGQDERFEEAIAALDRGLKLESSVPNLPENSRLMAICALAAKGVLLARLERHEEACAALAELSEHIRPEDTAELRDLAATAFRLCGNLLDKLDRHEEAIAAWQRASEYVRSVDPANLRDEAAHALKAKGHALEKLDRYEEAMAAWERTTEYVSPEDSPEPRLLAAKALVAKGTTFLMLERHDESAATWRRAAEYVHPDDPTETRRVVVLMLTEGSRLMYLHGKFEEAEALCRKAVELDPEHGESWSVLAQAILFQGDDARQPEAEACARRAVEMAPENPIAFHTLSDVLARRGQWVESLDQLERALAIGGGDFREQGWAGLTESLIPAVAAGYGLRVKQMMETAGLAEPMEPLWHAVRTELGEELEPLPAEIMETVADLRLEFARHRS